MPNTGLTWGNILKQTYCILIWHAVELSSIAWIPEWVLMPLMQAQGRGEIPLCDKNCFYWINILINCLGPWWRKGRIFNRETGGHAELKSEPLSFWNQCGKCSLTKTQNETSCMTAAQGRQESCKIDVAASCRPIVGSRADRTKNPADLL